MPANINKNSDDNGILPKMYINSILDKDINDDKERNREKMLMILKSLSRNESSMAGIQTIQKDITDNENGEDSNLSWNTITDYIDVLDRLYLIENQPAYGISYRSSKRIGTSFKRHLTDPSLACACLNLNSKRLLNDMNTFGFMFEALVERDLRIYMDYLNGQLYHFRDNTSGDEVDAILEFEDGEYAAIEIKLGFDKFNEAKDSLQRFYKNVKKKPKFMAMIYGPGENIIKDKETGIYAFPITTLKP